MIIRIVRMTFEKENIESFLQLYNEKKSAIRNFAGCTHLELWQHTTDPTIFFTYSSWIDEHHLEQYRISSFFRETWAKSKKWFSEKPEAWTVRQWDIVNE